jgi:hypothetical protein
MKSSLIAGSVVVGLLLGASAGIAEASVQDVTMERPIIVQEDKVPPTLDLESPSQDSVVLNMPVHTIVSHAAKPVAKKFVCGLMYPIATGGFAADCHWVSVQAPK